MEDPVCTVQCHSVSEGTGTPGRSQTTAVLLLLWSSFKNTASIHCLFSYSSSVIKEWDDSLPVKPTCWGTGSKSKEKSKEFHSTACINGRTHYSITSLNIWTISLNLDEKWLSLECLFPPFIIFLYLETVGIKQNKLNLHFHPRKTILGLYSQPGSPFFWGCRSRLLSPDWAWWTHEGMVQWLITYTQSGLLA